MRHRFVQPRGDGEDTAIGPLIDNTFVQYGQGRSATPFGSGAAGACRSGAGLAEAYSDGAISHMIARNRARQDPGG